MLSTFFVLAAVFNILDCLNILFSYKCTCQRSIMASSVRSSSILYKYRIRFGKFCLNNISYFIKIMTECIQRCSEGDRPQRFSKWLNDSNAPKLISYCPKTYLLLLIQPKYKAIFKVLFKFLTFFQSFENDNNWKFSLLGFCDFNNFTKQLFLLNLPKNIQL